MVSYPCIYLSLLFFNLVSSFSIRLLPQYLSFLSDGSRNYGTGYLEIPITEALLQQATTVDDYSLTLWYKNDINPQNAVPIFQITNSTWGSECCNFRDFNSILYFHTTTELVYGMDFYNYVGGRYKSLTSIATTATDLNWHFVGVTHSKTQQLVKLCRDGVCSQKTYSFNAPLTFHMVIHIGGAPSSFSGGFGGRIGDMVLYPNVAYGVTDFTSVQSAKVALPACTPIVGFGGSFYDACMEYGLAVSYLFTSQGTNLAPGLSTTSPITLTMTDPGVFYGRTMGQSFGISGYINSAVSPVFSFTRNSGAELYTFTMTAGSTLTVVQTFPPSMVAANQFTLACLPITTFLPFQFTLTYVAAGSTMYLLCGTATITPPAWVVAVSNPGDVFTFSGNMFGVVVTPSLPMGGVSSPPASAIDSSVGLSAGNMPTSTCAPGYYLNNNRCWQCHFSCQVCTGPQDDTCSTCNSGYYRQPTLASLCLPYCPTGYTASGTSCTLNSNPGLYIPFDNNLAGDFTLSTGQVIQMGWDPNMFYPDFDFLDPFPVQHRGVFYNISESIELPEYMGDMGSLILGTDFSIDMWILPYDYGSLFRTNTNNGWEDHDLLVFGICQQLEWPPVAYDYNICFGMQTNSQEFDYQVTSLSIAGFKTQWMHLGFTVQYNSGTDTSSVFLFLDSQTCTLTFPSYFKDSAASRHNIGFLNRYMPGYLGYIYSISISNVPKTMSNFLAERGTCAGCICPIVTNACLSTCGPRAYIDASGNCQPCMSSCIYGCTNPKNCDLCADPLCYKCATFDAGTCTQCIPGASLQSNICTCAPGTFVNNGKCSSSCDSWFYFDSVSGMCQPCDRGCVKCTSTTCLQCSSQYVLIAGICSCGAGWYITAALTCAKCNSICENCQDDKANCIQCYTEQGYVLLSASCVDCSSIKGYYGGLGKTNVKTTGMTDADAINAVCQEICGDGLTMGQLECDDGNLANGDGCSSLCQIEHGWTCTIPVAHGKSNCVDNTPPQAVLTYNKRSLAGYELTYSFSETVVVKGDLNTLANVQISAGSLFTYSFVALTIASDLYSPYNLTITSSETIPAGSTLTLNITDASLVTDPTGNKLANPGLTVTLPDAFTLTSSQAVTTAMAGLSGGIGGIAGIGFLLSFLGGANLGLLWGFMETMQLINYLVYMVVLFPDNLRHFLAALNFANFQFVPNFFDKYEQDEFDQPNVAFTMESQGTDLLINIGNMFTIWGVLLILFLVALALTKLFPKVRFFQTQLEKFQYSAILRCGTESFLQLALAVFLQLRNPSPHSTFGYFSLISCGGILLYLVISYFVTITRVTQQLPGALKDKEYKRKFGVLYEGYQLSSPVTRSFLLVVNSRRTIFVMALVFVYTSAIAQAVLMCMLTIGYIGALLLFRPYKHKWTGNIVNTAGEILFFFAQVLIAVMCYQDMDINTRNALGWLVIILLVAIIIMHLVAVETCQVLDLIKLVQKCNVRILKGSIMEDLKKKRMSALPEVGKAWVEDDMQVMPLEETKESESFGNSTLYPLVKQKFATDSPPQNSDSPDEEVDDLKPQFHQPKE